MFDGRRVRFGFRTNARAIRSERGHPRERGLAFWRQSGLDATGAEFIGHTL